MLRQNYENYTAENHHVWQLLFDRQMKQLPSMASMAYLEGIDAVGFVRTGIPNFDEVNKRLEKLTGWQIEVVKGLVPTKEFFELLNQKRFPSSTWLRTLAELDYLEEPDMFHDTFGHIPILSNQDFCNFLKGFSEIALEYIDNEWALKMISRLYWFTVEFGLIRDAESGLRIYGAGILSSSGESIYCLSDKPQHLPYVPEQIALTDYRIDIMQEKYFVIDSYKQLFESLPEIASVIRKYAEEPVLV